jgi:hypothetical protein
MSIKLLQMFLEKVAFVVINEVLNVVIESNNSHYVFTRFS